MPAHAFMRGWLELSLHCDDVCCAYSFFFFVVLFLKNEMPSERLHSMRVTVFIVSLSFVLL